MNKFKVGDLVEVTRLMLDDEYKGVKVGDRFSITKCGISHDSDVYGHPICEMAPQQLKLVEELKKELNTTEDNLRLGMVVSALLKAEKVDRICQELLDDVIKMSYNEVEELVEFYEKGE